MPDKATNLELRSPPFVSSITVRRPLGPYSLLHHRIEEHSGAQLSVCLTEVRDCDCGQVWLRDPGRPDGPAGEYERGQQAG